MKKILLTSLVLILIPALMFAPVLALLIYSTDAYAVDYADKVRGKWEVFQYYKGSERVACNDKTYMMLTLAEDSIIVEGTILEEVNTSYTWNSGASLSYESKGKTVTFFFSFDAQGNLKISVEKSDYILLLRRGEEE